MSLTHFNVLLPYTRCFGTLSRIPTLALLPAPPLARLSFRRKTANHSGSCRPCRITTHVYSAWASFTSTISGDLQYPVRVARWVEGLPSASLLAV